MRIRALFIAAIVAASVAVVPPSGAQSAADLVDVCLDNGGSISMCRGIFQFLRIFGGLCRDATADLPECEGFDGITIDETLVAAHESSWLMRALALQRGLDDSLPLHEELWPHTHNSYNADAYGPTIYGLDRNHIYSIRDQLRMGARAIEIDLHYAESTSGPGKAVVACHGEAVNIELMTVHAACGLNDPLVTDLFAEVRDWMDDNPTEIVMLYLENVLDNDEAAHNIVADAIEQYFGEITFRTPSNCAALPMDTSRREIRNSGARVLITGNCGPGGWGKWVHERGPRWREGGLDDGDDLRFAPPCTAERADKNYAHNWIRHWGDETGLSATAQAGGDVTVTDARNMVRCGVNMIGFDNLVPFDERLEQLAWSWAPMQPSKNTDGFCAEMRDDGRFYSSDCTVDKVTIKIKRKNRPPKKKVIEEFVSHPFACFDGTAWAVTDKSDRFSRGQATCTAEGLGTFSVPRSGYDNELLKAARGDAKLVWLNYRADDGAWLS